MIYQSQILQYLAANKQDFSRKYRLKKLGIFGSYARNERTPISDLDLLIEFEDDTSDLTEKKDFLRKQIQSVLAYKWIYAGKNISNLFSVNKFYRMQFMYSVSRRDYFCLLNMLDCIDKIRQYSSKFTSADDFWEDNQAFEASVMNFIIIGEMVEKLSVELIDVSNNEIDWFKIKGFRNILAHNYFGVDAEEVWLILSI